VTPGWSTIVAESGDQLEVDLAVPRWETLLALSCGERGAGALVGVVCVRERDSPSPGPSWRSSTRSAPTTSPSPTCPISTAG